MWPFKAKSEEIIPIEVDKYNAFTTNWQPKNARAELTQRLVNTFQRGLPTTQPIQNNGDYAMDSQYQNLTQAKYINSRYAGINETQLGWFAGQGFIGWQTCAILSQNWLIDKACTMPAKDASRNGYEITANDGTEIEPDILQYIRNMDKKFKVAKNCVEFVRMGRIFGIRVALFEVISDDPEYYEKPFNPDGIKPWSYKGISQIDPYWMVPVLDMIAAADPASKHFYEPTWWIINGRKIHRTHLVIMTTGELPDILKPTYFYGGIPIPQKIAERVYAAERTANEAPLLAMSKRLTVLKADTTAIEANQEAFVTKMQVWTEWMNNFGVKVIDGDEEITQFDLSLADLDDIIMTQFQLVAAASGVPATKLLGTAPKGFNATGEFDGKSYHEELESIQEHDLSPLVERHHLLLMRSHVKPRFNIAPINIEINWLPVDSPTAAENAEINFKKAQADATLSGTGAINGYDIRARLIADKNSSYNGLEIDDEIEVDSDTDE